MRAWVIRKKADVKDALRLESDYPQPTAKPGRVLVKVHAVALNPVNWKMIETWPVNLLQKIPGVPESDVAGTVVDGDLDGTGLQIGDSVFGLVPAEYTGKTGQGCLAEYVTVAKDLLIKKPDNLSFQQAATLPLATFTALNSLVATGGLKHGANQRVFIASCLCQLMHVFGARTCVLTMLEAWVKLAEWRIGRRWRLRCAGASRRLRPTARDLTSNPPPHRSRAPTEPTS